MYDIWRERSCGETKKTNSEKMVQLRARSGSQAVAVPDAKAKATDKAKSSKEEIKKPSASAAGGSQRISTRSQETVSGKSDKGKKIKTQDKEKRVKPSETRVNAKDQANQSQKKKDNVKGKGKAASKPVIASVKTNPRQNLKIKSPAKQKVASEKRKVVNKKKLNVNVNEDEEGGLDDELSLSAKKAADQHYRREPVYEDDDDDEPLLFLLEYPSKKPRAHDLNALTSNIATVLDELVLDRG
jgi:hypothetical protein